jgi:hypothetical protein
MFELYMPSHVPPPGEFTITAGTLPTLSNTWHILLRVTHE